jgi:hypothetical protein
MVYPNHFQTFSWKDKFIKRLLYSVLVSSKIKKQKKRSNEEVSSEGLQKLQFPSKPPFIKVKLLVNIQN